MALNQYCDLNEVRAALGVNDDELPNAVLSLPVYELGLVRELAKVSASLPAAFLAVSVIAEVDRTALQQALFSAGRIFSVYACARQVGVSLATMAPKSISDGKASVGRFSDSPYKTTLDEIDAVLEGARSDLVDAYAATVGGSTAATVYVPVIAVRSSRPYDPVTGT